MVVGSLSQADRAELRQRANGLRFAFANQFHASHERGADGSHSRQKDSQSSFWRRDLCWLFHSAPLFSSDFTCGRRPRSRKNPYKQTSSIAHTEAPLQITSSDFFANVRKCCCQDAKN